MNGLQIRSAILFVAFVALALGSVVTFTSLPPMTIYTIVGPIEVTGAIVGGWLAIAAIIVLVIILPRYSGGE